MPGARALLATMARRPTPESIAGRGLLGLCVALFGVGCAGGVDEAARELPRGPFGAGATAGDAAGTGSTVGGANAASGASGASGGGGSPATGGAPAPPLVVGGQTGAVAAAGAATCAAEEHRAMLEPLALFVVLDQSNSMVLEEDRWTPVTNALNAFANAPEFAGTQMGLEYFPFLADEDEPKCELETYATPDVPLGPLPAHAAVLASSLEDHHLTREIAEGPDEELRSGTPTRPAYAGARQYLARFLAENPDHVGAIVLATDGDPTGVCDDNGIDDVVDEIESAASDGIRTFVIGIGHENDLDEMARAGATGRDAFIIDTTGQTTEAEFLAALRAIRGAALPCELPLPEPTGGPVDPTRVNVELGEAGQSRTPLYQVASAAECGTSNDGWYYDDPAEPTRIALCPETCARASATVAGELRVVLGCLTMTRVE